MIRLPARRNRFPRTHIPATVSNSWGSQWAHLPRAMGQRLVRFGQGLRMIPMDRGEGPDQAP